MSTGRIIDIKRFAVHDGDGIRTTVFLKGCPLKCRWCHNPEGLSYKPQLAYYEFKCRSCGYCVPTCPVGAHKIEGEKHYYDRELCIGCGKCEKACLYGALKYYGRTATDAELTEILLADRLFYETSGGGITLSGGEALMQPEFCRDILSRMHEIGINTAVDTCGEVPFEAFQTVMPFTDTFLYDIKAIDDDVHKKCTGVSNRRILENFVSLARANCRVEVRVPYVPDLNGCEMEKIASFLKPFDNIVKIRVLPYHDYARSKYSALGLEDTLPETLPGDEIAAVEKLFDAIPIR